MTDNVDEELLARVEDQVLWLTLNRPDAGNAITPAVRNRMIEHLDGGERLASTCGPSCSPRPARSISAPAPTCARAGPRRPPKPEGAPERVAGEAARMIRTGHPAA